MIKLEESFKSGVGGYSQDPLSYKQLKRTESVAIYQRFYSDGRAKDFEVFRIKVFPKGKTIFNSIPLSDDTEQYPSSGQFGVLAWSYNHIAAAINKFNELCQQADDKATAIAEQEAIEISQPNSVSLFSTKDYAAQHDIEYLEASITIREAVSKGTMKFVKEERRASRGKPTKLYCEIS